MFSFKLAPKLLKLWQSTEFEAPNSEIQLKHVQGRYSRKIFQEWTQKSWGSGRVNRKKERSTNKSEWANQRFYVGLLKKKAKFPVSK
jgi:hypothetical protein